jgi:hypothetical protein
MRVSFGVIFLLLGVLVMMGFAIAGLVGVVKPTTGAAVGLGAMVVGTVAHFVDYYVGSRGKSDR